MFTAKFQAWVRRWAQRGAVIFSTLRLTPNMLTSLGLVISFAAALVLAFGNLLAAGLVMLFAGLFDVFDGALARRTGQAYPYGAFYDSTTDRYAEGAIYLGLMWYSLQQPDHSRRVALVFVALLGSQLVSYVRARAQSLGFTCDGGLFARPERVLLTAAGLIFPIILDPVLVLLAVMTNLTAVQRVWIVWRQAVAQRRAEGVNS
ncbi:MAG: CDP-alcohol phosphatidyltransferase family protein [Candidatus Dormibacteria bacterium]